MHGSGMALRMFPMPWEPLQLFLSMYMKSRKVGMHMSGFVPLVAPLRIGSLDGLNAVVMC